MQTLSRANHRGAPTRNAERDAEICRRVCAGEYLTHVARDYGLTCERVRQIAAKAGINAVAVRRELRARREAEARFRKGMRKDAMLAELRALAHRLGRTPSHTDINRADRNTIHNTTLYQRTFGSLRAAQIAAGLKPNPRGNYAGRAQKESAHAA